MKKRWLCALLLLALPAFAVEGKWTPQQVLELDPAWLRQLGLQIPPESLWGRDGAGLLEAAVQVNGCSAGFVSADGLLITNHHCAFGLLQQHSTPERDLMTAGYLARSRAEELSGQGARATIPHRTTDVTAQIEAAVPRGADDLARFRAIERRKKELTAACEAQPDRRCQVEAFDDGVQYVLFESLEFQDVRLVYAPPRAVGEYGGEIDNWSWPRHNGDFALLRVYAGPGGSPARPAAANTPYPARHFFPIAREGVQPGDFVMVAGYPGTTVRSLIEPEMRERGDFYHPRRAELYRAWIDLLEAASAKDETARIALADRIKSLANQEKNSRGQVAGLRRGHVLEKKQESEQEILAWAAARPAHAPAVEARNELARLMQARMATWERDFLLEQAIRGAKPLHMALTLARWAGEKAKPDLEREPDYMDRSRDRTLERLRLDQGRMFPPAEQELLADFLARFAALPEGSRSAAVDAFLGAGRSPAEIRKRVADLFARTRVTDLAERLRMFDESEAQLRARRDPLLDLALGLDRELLDRKEREDRYKGAASRLRPVWMRAVIEHAGGPVAMDANSTLRVSFAHVEGYGPRDAVRMEPRTTLAGVVEKHTGEEPFDAPDELLAAAPDAPRSRWADPALHDVPVNFLADADTTGGSSGSPVVNGRGELVGVNFDRVWENVANDFGYVPEVARNVSVDVRYLLWMLDTLNGEAARALLRELGAEGPAAAGR
ncbi:MAG: S46 family peptidase [Acidobacteriota bacterium]